MSSEVLIALITAISTVLANVILSWRAIRIAQLAKDEARGSAKRAEMAADQAQGTVTSMMIEVEKVKKSK